MWIRHACCIADETVDMQVHTHEAEGCEDAVVAFTLGWRHAGRSLINSPSSEPLPLYSASA